MEKPSLNELSAFAAIADHRSFRKAADALGLSPSTLSHMMRTLETRIGVRLFHRTTRSVSLTDGGDRLLARLRPVLRDLDQALLEIDTFRARPSGVLRINAPDAAGQWLLRTTVPAFLGRYPEIELDLVIDGRFVDIVEEGFDAGIRLGEAVPQDMIAVRFGGDARFLPVASPAYLAAHPRPLVPDDLFQHQCIRFRMPSGKRYRWEFEKHGQEVVIDAPGTLSLNTLDLMVLAACEGIGIAYVSETSAAVHLQSGRLVALLEDWCPPLPGLYLYYSGHRLVPATLRAFIDVLRTTAGRPMS